MLDSEHLSQFRASDFAASQGEYKDWKGDARRRSSFIKGLVAVIRTNINKMFLLTVENDVWSEVNRDYPIVEKFNCPDGPITVDADFRERVLFTATEILPLFLDNLGETKS